MQLPNSILFDMDKAGRASGPNAVTHDRHCSAQRAPDCARSQIADALTAILFQAEAIRLGIAIGGSAEGELDLSVRHIINSAKRVWSVLGDIQEATCICRKPPS
jgi:hypothetical protein